MKKILFIYFIVLLSVSSTIRAQAISLSEVPESKWSGMYLKDIDNTLPQFTGIWKAQFEGNEITLDISGKVEKFPIKGTVNYDSDVLFMRYTVKTNTGQQLATTMNKPVTEANIISTVTSPDRQKVGFDYSGEACGIGSGGIILTKIDDSHFKWNYRSVGGIMDLSKCPEYSKNIKSYIYMTDNLTFTKQ